MTSTTATVASITKLEIFGIVRMLRTEAQLNVPTQTVSMIATSDAIGMRPAQSPSTTTEISRPTPATSVERRLRPPERTLMID